MKHSKNTAWLDHPKNVTKLWRALILVCLGTLIAEPFVHLHPHFEVENWFGFYGWYGFSACVAMVLIAVQFRKLVRRDEAYYENQEDAS